MTGIDLVNGTVGAVLGIVFATQFQQPLQNAWFTIRRRSATTVRSLTYRSGGAPLSSWSPFSIGPLHTSALVVEGDGEQAIAPESIRVQVLEGEVVLPEEMAPWRAVRRLR
ncbi:hypothetical protein ACFYOA_29630 [Streptomyces iakyrus]|uniref:hypothetical protein n=1 Tax=Streptomyces iakyrus TaxID=68219 RepID=UPI00367DB4D2